MEKRRKAKTKCPISNQENRLENLFFSASHSKTLGYKLFCDGFFKGLSALFGFLPTQRGKKPKKITFLDKIYS